MSTDITIAQSIELQKIGTIAERAGMPADKLIPYGHHIAKVPIDLIDEEKAKKHNLVLVTAISPTKAGIGKTTVSIGLSMALNKLGKTSILALREPSLGPCFGMKGGATGGGYAQVLPMEKINLHFTGDFHAITSAHNMITAMLDNYIYQYREDGFMLKEVYWKRVLDVNDRNLRNIITGLGANTNGVTQENGFDITPASELMAILCLASDVEDLKRRIENILLGVKADDTPFTVKDLGVAGAITVLLQDALQPNLVQTVEHTPAFVHGGPFANIAHGCNSILATKLAMTFSEYAITEAGFGADLGAEKFLNIKCRKAGVAPKVTVLVATLRGLKMHGGMHESDINKEGADAIMKGLENLDKHVANLQRLGQNVVVTLNRYSNDSPMEIGLVAEHCHSMNIRFAENNAWGEGGGGALNLAQMVVEAAAENSRPSILFSYQDEDDILTKIEQVAHHIYGAKKVVLSKGALRSLDRICKWGYSRFPVCIAKTQYSFSDDAKRYGVAKDFTLAIRELIINSGAEMVVAVAGDVMRMPGLPRHPQAEKIDVVNGVIVGLE